MKVSPQKFPFFTCLPKKLIRIITVTTIITGGLIASPAHATDGTLDTTFGTSGITTTNITQYAFSNSAAVQVDGKIVVVGQHSPSGNGGSFLIARYNANGTLDATFGTNGITVTSFGTSESAQSVVIQADGKILVAGYSDAVNTFRDFAVLRYNANGTLDTSFGTNGITTTNLGSYDTGYSMALQADGKILVAGQTGPFNASNFAIVRYAANGTLDTSFGTAGITTTDLGGVDSASSMVVLPNGKILVAGRSFDASKDLFAIVRYNTNGTLDTGFGAAGITTTSFDAGDGVGNSMTLQADGKIIVAGGIWLGNRWIIAMARHNTDGTLDTSFGTAGTTTTDLNADSIGSAVAVQLDGKIIVAGNFDATGTWDYDFALYRYNANGSLDTTFDTDGLITTNLGGSDSASSIVMQADGKIVVVGGTWLNNAYQFALARFNTTPLAATLAAPSPTSSSATITFTLTGTETVDCATLSTVAGVDFNVTNISAIDSITQTSPTECTISATSSAASDGVPVTSTLATSSSFSVGFSHGNTRSTVGGASQSVIVTLPESAPTATEPAPTTTVVPPTAVVATTVVPPTAVVATTVVPPTAVVATTVVPPTAVVATTIASPVVASVKKFDSLPETGSNRSTSAIFGFLLVLAGFVLVGRRRMVKDI
jgi:uncharacterized delta-60 repeat protein/LPXTG-motif cell wall-anchored protein